MSLGTVESVDTPAVLIEELPPEEQKAIEGRSPMQLAFARLRGDKIVWFAVTMIIAMALLAILADVIALVTGHGPLDANELTGTSDTGQPLPPGSNGYLLGTDDLGRDILVRIAYGARISLGIGVVATLIATAVGVVVGLLAGYFGGWVDGFLARIMDAVLSLPYLLFAIALASVAQQQGWDPKILVTGVIAFFSWAAIGRVVRGQALSQKVKEYVEAAHSMGAGNFRIMFIDILPNLIAPVIVLGTLLIPVAIVFEATLSFLGVGIPLPTPSWGNMLAFAENFYGSWWYWIFPSLALLITTLGFNLLGDAVRDAMDPRSERIFAARRKRKVVDAAPAAAAPAEA